MVESDSGMHSHLQHSMIDATCVFMMKNSKELILPDICDSLNLRKNVTAVKTDVYDNTQSFGVTFGLISNIRRKIATIYKFLIYKRINYMACNGIRIPCIFIKPVCAVPVENMSRSNISTLNPDNVEKQTAEKAPDKPEDEMNTSVLDTNQDSIWSRVKKTTVPFFSRLLSYLPNLPYRADKMNDFVENNTSQKRVIHGEHGNSDQTDDCAASAADKKDKNENDTTFNNSLGGKPYEDTKCNNSFITKIVNFIIYRLGIPKSIAERFLVFVCGKNSITSAIRPEPVAKTSQVSTDPSVSSKTSSLDQAKGAYALLRQFLSMKFKAVFEPLSSGCKAIPAWIYNFISQAYNYYQSVGTKDSSQNDNSTNGSDNTLNGTQKVPSGKEIESCPSLDNNSSAKFTEVVDTMENTTHEEMMHNSDSDDKSNVYYTEENESDTAAINNDKHDTTGNKMVSVPNKLLSPVKNDGPTIKKRDLIGTIIFYLVCIIAIVLIGAICYKCKYIISLFSQA